jgi:ElaB/YqjD/DUF883 family membrane-anchored ribosome-binding protein
MAQAPGGLESRDPAELERKIDDTRARLDENLAAIERKARATMSVRRRVAERPWAAVGSALAVGFVAGLIRGR